MPPVLVIDQDMNTPPRLVAVDPRTNRRRVVFDPNPGLLTTFRFGREERVEWKTRTGVAWRGGLYRPADYTPGKRYPLVIQTHDFDAKRFWPEGPVTTGYAAQPLAALGIMVLQTDEVAFVNETTTPREGPAFIEGIESAVAHLDRLGLIDRTKVALVGFSHTCFLVQYLLAHSSVPLAAVTLNDGASASYMEHMWFPLDPSRRYRFAELTNGAAPFGPGLDLWRKRAPNFNLERVTAPVRIFATWPVSLFIEWEVYASLTLQKKPVEMLYLPEGMHVLAKPWERMAVQQGTVDWFDFWLNGRERTEPVAAVGETSDSLSVQYARWRAMRSEPATRPH